MHTSLLLVRRIAAVLVVTALALLGVSWPAHAGAGIPAGKCEAGGGTVGGDGGGGKVCIDGLFNGYKVI